MQLSYHANHPFVNGANRRAFAPAMRRRDPAESLLTAHPAPAQPKAAGLTFRHFIANFLVIDKIHHRSCQFIYRKTA
ncbi:hypothetical protein [Cypionkella sinensis]|uniref:Uncharacterized protein n=1 Tax=Cypionkella sinensis TaxID=1756043 RepID=A0ABV7J1G9_9RHOB